MKKEKKRKFNEKTAQTSNNEGGDIIHRWESKHGGGV